MSLCVKCGEDTYSGVVIKGRDHCHGCADDLKAQKDLQLVNQYPYGRVRVHNLLDLWKSKKVTES